MGVAVEQRFTAAAMQKNLRELPPVFDLAIWQKWEGIPQALFGLHGPTTTLPTFLTLAGAVALLWADRFAHRERAPLPLRARLHAHRFALLGAALVVAYFEVPFAFHGAMWIHARFLAPAVALLAVALAPPSAYVWRASQVATVAPVVATLALLAPELRATGALYGDLAPLLPRVALGSAIAPIDAVGGSLRGLVFSVAGATAWVASERGGRVAVSFTQSSQIPPVIVAPGERWEGALERMSKSGLAFAPAFDFRRFRYALAWTLAGQDAPLIEALAPEARLVARSGGWLLFESTLPVAPVTSAEPAFDGAESVAARLALPTHRR
jgi:hypothetical protein